MAQIDEISKQDALRETGVSYGQFYRWKRMGLIPEAWFRRRSTFTGHETFLPREKLLERIGRIQELKDRYSLEDIAEMLSPDVTARSYSQQEAERAGLFSAEARALFPGPLDAEAVGFVDLVCLAVIEHLSRIDTLSDDQIRLAAETVRASFRDLAGAGGERRLAIVLQDGASVAALHVGECRFDPRSTVAASVNLDDLAEQLKLRLSEHVG
jgi:DNA-binding transcriptional MerR regulator